MMNANAIQTTQTIVPVKCCQCGVLFGLEASHQAKLRESKKLFHCPNGHEQLYSRSEADKLRDELQRKERDVQWERSMRDLAEAEARDYRRRMIAQKAAKQRIKNRVANGVCPCCNRTFANLGRHMKNQHPDFAGERE